MVRYQKQLAYRYKRKSHFKHVVLVSSKTAKELGWKPGQELQEKVVARQTLVISPEPQPRTSRKARKQ